MDPTENQDSKETAEFSITTIEWNNNIENVLRKMSDTCNINKISYYEIASKESFRYNILMYIVIFTGPLSGVLSSISSSDICDIDCIRSLQICITVLSFFTGFLTAIIKFSKLDQKSTSYKSFSAKYMSLQNNINRQLSLSPQDRCNPGQYLEYISKSFDDLYATAPLLEEKGKDNNPIENIVINSPNPDINQFSDPKMTYEMNRFNNFNK